MFAVTVAKMLVFIDFFQLSWRRKKANMKMASEHDRK